MDGLLLNCLNLQSIQFLVEHLQGWRVGEERSSYQWLMRLTSALDSKVLSVTVVLHMQYLPYVCTYVIHSPHHLRTVISPVPSSEPWLHSSTYSPHEHPSNLVKAHATFQMNSIVYEQHMVPFSAPSPPPPPP